jgi:hypothetical protein
MGFTFNGNYRDKEQVRQFLSQFTSLREAMEAAGQYPYNAQFVGKIDGAAGPDEETAIYLLQNLYRIEQEERTMDGFRAEMTTLAEIHEQQKFSRVVAYRSGHYVGGTGTISSWDDARIVPKDGKPYAVLPKGRRTNGYLINGTEVLVTP